MKYIRLVIVVIFLLYIGWQAVFSIATVKTQTDFKSRTKYWSMIMPEGRVVKTPNGIVANEEPLYFELKLPPRTKSITLTLNYSGNGNVNLGTRRGVDWNYEFTPARVEATNDHTTYTITADSPNYLESNHTQRFLISVGSLSPGGVTITQASAQIIRQRVSVKNIWQSIFNQ